jgi:transposase
MARGYSDDLRVRVIHAVDGGETARGSARIFVVGDSTAIRWVKRWRETGAVSAKPGTGHSRSPLKQHAAWLLELVQTEPDLTLEEIRDRLCAERGLASSVSALWRFYDRNGISFKKKRARGRAGSS